MQLSESVQTSGQDRNRYTILDRIGEGTFAVTYRARDLALDRIVALKILRPQFAADPAFSTRFAREARAAALINHPQVVNVYDYGLRDDGPFLVLQYIAGRDLKELIRREGPGTPADAVRIGIQILRGLEAIHSAGLVHRDIKPQNILLDDDLNAYVSDFGIALNSAANSLLTSDGTTLGTPSYMAPEQARGDTITPATDLYAVGVILFEILTGRLPFTGDNPLTVMLAHVQHAPPSLRDVATQQIPPALEAVVGRALAKDPRDRFPNATAMARALEQSLNGSDAETTLAIPPVLAAGPTRPLNPTVPSRAVSAGFDRPRSNAASRRLALWLAPLLVVAAIGLIWVGVKALGNGDDDGENPQLGLLSTVTATSRAGGVGSNLTRQPTETLVAEVAATKTPDDEDAENSGPQPTRRPTRTVTVEPEPSATDEPTETAPPEPTLTPEPTFTAEPPTATPENSPPTIAPTGNGSDGNDGAASDGGNGSAGEPVEQEEGGGESNQGGVIEQRDNGNAGRGGQEKSGNANAQATSLTFGPEDWEGGYHRADSGFLGRPWVAVYGAQSGLGTVSLPFTLDKKPKNAMLTITGINDEWASPNPITIEINGVTIYEGPCPFPSWNGAGDGANAAWGTMSWAVPKNALRKGDNEIVVRNFTDSASTNSPPYVNISTTTIEVE